MYLYVYLFLKCNLLALGLVNVFLVEIKIQNKKEKSESNANLKNQGNMPWRVWDLGLQGQHIPMVRSLKWEIPATGCDWIQHWYEAGVTA